MRLLWISRSGPSGYLDGSFPRQPSGCALDGGPPGDGTLGGGLLGGEPPDNSSTDGGGFPSSETSGIPGPQWPKEPQALKDL